MSKLIPNFFLIKLYEQPFFYVSWRGEKKREEIVRTMRRVGGKASTALFAGGGKRNFIIAFVMRFLLYCLQAIVRLEVYREWNGQRVQCRRLFAIYTYIQEPRNLLSDAWRIYLFFTHWQTILFLCREKIFLQFSFNNILVRKQVNW